MLRKILTLLQAPITSAKSKGSLRKTKGQSMAELAITLPTLILLFLGMVEFGFMLNTYLSLQDATRAAARYYANSVPYEIENEGTEDATIVFNEGFHENVALFVVNTLAPPPELASRQIVMDETRDNVLVSVVSVDVDETATPPTITSITRLPEGELYYKLYKDSTSPASAYTSGNIEDYMTANGSTPVDAGLLIIEIYYGYEGTLGLLFTDPFFSENNPAMLYASTIMPFVAAKP